MPEVNMARHVLTFTSGEFPDKSHDIYGSLGDKNVKAKIEELSEAMKEGGYPHTVTHTFPKTIAEGNRKPRKPRAPATVAPIQEPQAEPAAEESTEARHSRRAAA